MPSITRSRRTFTSPGAAAVTVTVPPVKMDHTLLFSSQKAAHRTAASAASSAEAAPEVPDATAATETPEAPTPADAPMVETAPTVATTTDGTTVDEVYTMARKALDQQEIQNIMSWHVMYHCYGPTREELESYDIDLDAWYAAHSS